MSTIDVNGTTLYHERRGSGPPVLFISGATGDAGHWTAVADALADEYTVLTYDRRANSRSPRPPGWSAAPVDEQAAILHEPPFAAVTSAGDAVGASFKALIDDGMQRGGPRLAMELFLRTVAGDEVYDSFDPDLRERMLGNAEVAFGLEFEPVFAYMPTPEEFAGVRVPCVVAAGEDNKDPTSSGHWFYEAAQWLATQLGAPLVEFPDAHVPQASSPQALTEALRPILARSR